MLLRLREKRILAILAGCATVVGIGLLAVPRPFIQISAQPLVVRPNEVVEITTEFSNTWPGPLNPGAKITVVDEDGKDHFWSLATLLGECRIEPGLLNASGAEATRADLRACVAQQEGFAEGAVEQILRGWLLSQVEKASCPSGLGHSSERPPHRSEVMERILVLPATPPGVYTLQVPEDRYCDPALTSPGAQFRVTVERPG